jgi:hypothetical protein
MPQEEKFFLTTGVNYAYFTLPGCGIVPSDDFMGMMTVEQHQGGMMFAGATNWVVAATLAVVVAGLFDLMADRAARSVLATCWQRRNLPASF